MKSFGNKIKALRRKMNLTQEELAERLNVSFQAVSKWETNASLPDVTMFPLLANFFNVTTDELFGVDLAKKQAKIDEIIKEYEDLGYIDDYEYAKNYYELKSSSKSLRYIQNMLRSKGVSDWIINEVLADADCSNEIKQIEKFLDSKLKGNKDISISEKNKIIASLFRKGYKTSNIYLTISQYLA